jgi:hypothetical protein
MYIEDIIDDLVGMGSFLFTGQASFFSSKDMNFLCSINSQTNLGRGLTLKQSSFTERILKSYSVQISTFLNRPIQHFLDNPQYRLPIRTITQDKTIKVIEGKLVKKEVSLMFPYDEAIITRIKEYKKTHDKETRLPRTYGNDTVYWHPEERTWNFYAFEEHIDWIGENFENLGFLKDEEFKNYYAEIQGIKNNMEQYVPMVIFKDNQFSYINAHKNIPQPSSTDLVSVLFEAKKHGIYTWDENIDLALELVDVSPLTKKILRKINESQYTIDNRTETLDDAFEIIEQAKTCLITIPGGSELESLKFSYNFLMSHGYTSDQISVLFRLDGSAGKMCNEFVKEKKINNPISDKIKVFFISGKVPKPLMAEKVVFDVIINLGSNSAHYTQKNLIQTHNCVINYTIDRKNLTTDYANL